MRLSSFWRTHLIAKLLLGLGMFLHQGRARSNLRCHTVIYYYAHQPLIVTKDLFCFLCGIYQLYKKINYVFLYGIYQLCCMMAIYIFFQKKKKLKYKIPKFRLILDTTKTFNWKFRYSFLLYSQSLVEFSHDVRCNLLLVFSNISISFAKNLVT